MAYQQLSDDWEREVSRGNLDNVKTMSSEDFALVVKMLMRTGKAFAGTIRTKQRIDNRGAYHEQISRAKARSRAVARNRVNRWSAHIASSQRPRFCGRRLLQRTFVVSQHRFHLIC